MEMSARLTDKALFKPSLGYYPSVAHIPHSLFGRLIRYLILDVDNTLAQPMDSFDVPMEIVTALHELKQSGSITQLCLVSNMMISGIKTRERRIEHIAEVVGAAHIVRAYWPRVKPHPQPFEQALSLMGVPSSQVWSVAVIDDQLHTGIRGGNELGMETIKVDPLGPDPIWTAWKRVEERRLMRELGVSYAR